MLHICLKSKFYIRTLPRIFCRGSFHLTQCLEELVKLDAGVWVENGPNGPHHREEEIADEHVGLLLDDLLGHGVEGLQHCILSGILMVLILLITIILLLLLLLLFFLVNIIIIIILAKLPAWWTKWEGAILVIINEWIFNNTPAQQKLNNKIKPRFQLKSNSPFPPKKIPSPPK